MAQASHCTNQHDGSDSDQHSWGAQRQRGRTCLLCLIQRTLKTCCTVQSLSPHSYFLRCEPLLPRVLLLTGEQLLVVRALPYFFLCVDVLKHTKIHLLPKL